MAFAEQPAQEHTNLAELNKPSDSSIDDSSAARPAPQRHPLADPRSLRECSDWLNGLSHQEIAESKPVQRLLSATTVLQQRSSRQQRQEVQKLLDAWDVPQKAHGRKRKYEEEGGFSCKSC